jgi:hypothetical protein
LDYQSLYIHYYGRSNTVQELLKTSYNGKLNNSFETDAKVGLVSNHGVLTRQKPQKFYLLIYICLFIITIIRLLWYFIPMKLLDYGG